MLFPYFPAKKAAVQLKPLKNIVPNNIYFPEGKKYPGSFEPGYSEETPVAATARSAVIPTIGVN